MNPSPELALLRELRTRRMDREAVPMVLALRDERSSSPGRAPSASSDEGAALAARLAALAALLAPTQRADDLGFLETLLQVLAYEDFVT